MVKSYWLEVILLRVFDFYLLLIWLVIRDYSFKAFENPNDLDILLLLWLISLLVIVEDGSSATVCNYLLPFVFKLFL